MVINAKVKVVKKSSEAHRDVKANDMYQSFCFFFFVQGHALSFFDRGTRNVTVTGIVIHYSVGAH